MLNRHFIKRLFFFVLILAGGAFISLVVNYVEDNKNGYDSSQFNPVTRN